MANIGTAIAQGIATGIGQAGQQYYADQRREKRDIRQMARGFENFKKQQDYSDTLRTERERRQALFQSGVTDITSKKQADSEWRAAAQLSPSDLAYQIATKQSSQFSKEQRPAFFRDTIKRLNGMSKVELMTKAGYTLSDYSEYADKPEYADAIPTPKVGGMEAMPDASSVFKYDPKTYEALQKQQGEKMSAFMEKRKTALSGIKDSITLSFGIQPSPEAQALILDGRPSGQNVVMEGANAISYDDNYTRSLIETGKLVPYKGQLVPATLAAIDEGVQERQAGLTMPPETLYEEPQAAAQIQKEETEKVEMAKKAAVKRVEDKQNKVIKSYQSLNELAESSKALSEGAKEYLYGAISAKGVLGTTKASMRAAAKAGDEDALEALKFLSLMETVSATIKHDQYGSAQTRDELKNFANQLGDPSLLQNPETLLDQIQTRMTMIKGGIMAGVGTEDRAAYLETHPEAKNLFSAPETKETVSDLSKDAGLVDPQLESYVESLIAAGKYKAEDKDALILHIMKQQAKGK